MKKVNSLSVILALFYRLRNFVTVKIFKIKTSLKTFSDLEHAIREFEKVSVANLNYEDFNKFKEQVKNMQDRLIFLGTSDSVHLNWFETKRHSGLVYRNGKVVDEINSKDLPYKRMPFKGLKTAALT